MVHWKAPLPLLAAPGGPPQLWRKIADDTVSSAATYDLTWADDFALVWLRLIQFRPVTNGVRLQIRTSGDGGSTFDSGASDYSRQCTGRIGALGLGQTTGADAILCQNPGSGVDVNNAAGYGIAADIYVLDPGAAKRTQVLVHGVHRNSAGVASVAFQVSGVRKADAAVDGLQLFFSAGNIDSGRVLSRGIHAYGAGS